MALPTQPPSKCSRVHQLLKKDLISLINIHPILLNMLAKSTTLYKPSTREPLTIWQAIDNHILFVLAENYAWDSCSWPFLEYVCISLKRRALYKYI